MTQTQPREDVWTPGLDFNHPQEVQAFESLLSNHVRSFLETLDVPFLLFRSYEEIDLVMPVTLRPVDEMEMGVYCNILGLESKSETSVFEQLLRAYRLYDLYESGEVVFDLTRKVIVYDEVEYPLVASSVQEYFDRPFVQEALESAIEVLWHDGYLSTREEGRRRVEQEKIAMATRLYHDCNILH